MGTGTAVNGYQPGDVIIREPPTSGSFDMVNQPPHYKSHPMECIDEMLVAFGEKMVWAFCVCNAWKYRYRAKDKGNYEQDMEKSDWYMKKANEIKSHLQYPHELYDTAVE